MEENKSLETNSKPSPKSREDVDAVTSSRPGWAGLVESTLRRFRLLAHLGFLFIIYAIGTACMGLSFVPGVYLFICVHDWAAHWPFAAQLIATGITLAAGFFLYGFTLILVVPLFNFILPTRLKSWRGTYYSLSSLPWYLHNSLTYMVRYTFLKFITPTPFNMLFYRLMGMKIGRGVQINSTDISDPCLLQLEDKVTIGGSATIVSHYASGGYLILAPVRIRKGATIGLRAIIMGDVEIGERARIMPGSVILPKTRVPADEVWGGVPAALLKKDSPAS